MSASEDILEIPAPRDGERLAYGSDPYHFGDLRLPVSAGPHPVVIGIHGGYYRARYGLAYFGHACAALTALGFATWNIEYRRLGNPGGGWPGTFIDIAAAADHLRALAETYTLDLARVVTLGHSAGGHFACWLAARQRIAANLPLYTATPLPIHAAVSLAGVLDLRRAWELRLSDGVVRQLMGGTPEDYPDRYAAASPSDLLPLGLPQILIHGTADSNVPYAISADYAAAAQAKGDDVDLVTLEGVGHFEIVDPRADEWRVVVAAVQRAAGAR